VHEVLLERAAERDLKALSRAVYDRIVSHLKNFPKTHDLLGARKLQGRVVTGVFV
jgi:mRNA-degrading endonuclease RelE of RelBE toxin-antitoxin system